MLSALDWLTSDNEPKEHLLFGESRFSTEAPGVRYELKQVMNPKGDNPEGLFVAWITLNNPKEYNSYTTDMVKAVIAAFTNASLDRRVVAVVFTGEGDISFCTGGNVREYAAYYAGRPHEYGTYMDLFLLMIDSILNCRKLVIARINGMCIAGGQELRLFCDRSVVSDLARLGQAGPT